MSLTLKNANLRSIHAIIQHKGRARSRASSGATCDHSSISTDNGKCATTQYQPTLLPGCADPACTRVKSKHALCNYIRARPPCSQVGLPLAALKKVDVQIKLISVSPSCSQAGLALLALKVWIFLR